MILVLGLQVFNHDEIVHEVTISDVKVGNGFNNESHFEIEIDGFVVLTVDLQADFIQILKLLK